MKTKSAAGSLFSILVLLNIAIAIYYYSSLPELVAIHFTLSGEPDGWNAKAIYLGFQIGLSLFILLFFFGLVKMLNMLPDSALNIPHQDYWLAPERRDQTISQFQILLYNIGSATMLLFFILHFQINRANLDDVFRSDILFWPVMVGWLLLLMVITIRGYRYFNFSNDNLVEKDQDKH